MKAVKNIRGTDGSSPGMRAALTAADVEHAAQVLKPFVHQSPVLNSPLVDDRLGLRVFCKAESLQVTGSFKIRGVFNKLLGLTEDEKRRGVVAFSAGNHAQSLAYAGHVLGIETTVFMPNDAPRIKIEKTRAYGAIVRLYDRATEDREVLLDKFVERIGAVPVRPYDDYPVMAGGGTVALEFIDQIGNEGLDVLFVPCGGGGLAAGCATILSKCSPRTEVYSVEPDGFDDTAQSLSARARKSNTQSGKTLCDSLITTIPGTLTFPINLTRLAGGFTVEEDEVLDAIRLAYKHFQLVVEAGGAVGLAAACAWNKKDGKRLGVILTGGNVDPDVFAQVLGGIGCIPASA